MALPVVLYRDPAEIMERIEMHESRAQRGCSVCRFRGAHLGWGKYDCSAGCTAGSKGWCRHWLMQED